MNKAVSQLGDGLKLTSKDLEKKRMSHMPFGKTSKFGQDKTFDTDTISDKRSNVSRFGERSGKGKKSLSKDIFLNCGYDGSPVNNAIEDISTLNLPLIPHGRQSNQSLLMKESSIKKIFACMPLSDFDKYETGESGLTPMGGQNT